MNINENSLKSTFKRERNWNNSNNHKSKRHKKGITFKNKNNMKNLNMTPNAIFSRKSVGVSKNRENLPDFMTNRSIAYKRHTNVNRHRKETLKNLKNQGKYFKNNSH
jgi:hypothetical protein